MCVSIGSLVRTDADGFEASRFNGMGIIVRTFPGECPFGDGCTYLIQLNGQNGNLPFSRDEFVVLQRCTLKQQGA